MNKIRLSASGCKLHDSALTVLHPVMVVGVLAPSGKILDAHSLQPADPRSEEAVQAAAKLGFRDSTPPGEPPCSGKWP